jgi:DNA-directed RNA polymerase subunit RPC12/RpoP
MNNLKITKILIIIFIFSLVLQATSIYLYNPHKEVKCPNCNSTDTEIMATDEFEPEYKCHNCGAFFWQSGDIMSFDKNINNN